MFCREGRPADGEAAHVVVLFEFQSRPDRHMAWRMHEYMYLLELNLRDVGVHRGRMPDMLSVVVYNGDRSWTGAPHRHGPLVGPPTAAGRALNRWRALELIDYHALARGADLFGRPLPPEVWLMRCASADELLARVRTLGHANANTEPGAEQH